MANQSNQNDNTAKQDDLMGYEQAKAPETTLPETSTAKDTQTLINDAVKQVTVGEDGKYVYPTDMDPMLKAAVAASKSYRDNQSGFTKSQQSLKESEAEVKLLREKLSETVQKPLELTKERQAELDDLMYTNPKEWRTQMNKLEQQSSVAANEALDEVTKKARGEATAEHQLQLRVDYLGQFNEGRETPITVDTLDNDVPKRINDKLANGSVSFEEYLDEVSTYLITGKVVASSTPPQTTDLNKSNGSSDGARQSDQEKQAELDYSQMAF